MNNKAVLWFVVVWLALDAAYSAVRMYERVTTHTYKLTCAQEVTQGVVCFIGAED